MSKSQLNFRNKKPTLFDTNLHRVHNWEKNTFGSATPNPSGKIFIIQLKI